MNEYEWRKLYECEWPASEIQLKINTCGACAYFKPPDNRDAWKYAPKYKKETEGSCSNMKATLGGAISTHRDSRCKHYEPAKVIDLGVSAPT
jgi:hypothetical protein